ncbi:MAG: hypothetical protein SOZ34_08580 [Clostridia bacterium]|nr:hypothetical protein [Clostridia bacterium]
MRRHRTISSLVRIIIIIKIHSIIGTASIKKGKNVFRLFADKINKNDCVGLNVSKVVLEVIK